MQIRGRALILALALLAPTGRPARADEPSPAPSEAREGLTQALEALSSPFFRERQAAAQRLAAMLPGARAAVLAAWRAGGDDVRAALAPVLGRDGSAEAVGLLLEAWIHGHDALAAHARDALLDDPAATRAGLEQARRATPPPDVEAGARPLAAIEQLLARDEVERLFLGRKSRSGGTGFYRGQYESLAPQRELALDVCLHILTDRALRMPGASAVGGYRFLRPVAQVLDVWEVRSMALNALLDLATPKDRALLAALDAYYHELLQRGGAEEEGGGASEDPEREAFLDDLLATLYRLEPMRYEAELRRRFAELTRGPGRFSRGLQDMRVAAALALRAGWYEEATDLYAPLARSSVSRAHDHYNLACAYAQWSLEPGEQDPAELRAQALTHLEISVAERWSDLDWMEQDRDLDPVRDTERYRALKATIQARLAGDGSEPAPRAPAPRRR